MGKIHAIGTNADLYPTPIPSQFLNFLDWKLIKLIKPSVAPSTLDMHNKGLENFNNFRIKHMPENAWPPQVDHIANFIAFLSSKGLSYSTAKCYI